VDPTGGPPPGPELVVLISKSPAVASQQLDPLDESSGHCPKNVVRGVKADQQRACRSPRESIINLRESPKRRGGLTCSR
jgi:hypothetical protein